MKIFLTLIIFIFSASFSFAQNESPSLKITGTVKEIAMQESFYNKKSADFYITYITLNLKLTNTSSIPVIFLQDEPVVNYAEVVKIGDENDIFFAETSGATSSYAMKIDEWEKLRKGLDKPKPPKKKTRIVMPNGKIEFEGFVRLNIPKVLNYQPILGGEIKTLDFMQKYSPAKIKIRLKTWSTLFLLINGKSGEYKKKDFAEILKGKWKNFGYLWTENIEAEPISIDFNSVIFKTLIN